MKINLDWMKQYIDLPEYPDELIEVLPMLGLEVEEDESSASASLPYKPGHKEFLVSRAGCARKGGGEMERRLAK